MSEHIHLVAEGAHDVAFLGHLLRVRGFKEVQKLSQLPEIWASQIPKRFPSTENQQLHRVVRYPTVWKHDERDIYVGISFGRADSGIEDSLSSPIDLNDLASFAAIGVLCDCDHGVAPKVRHKQLLERLKIWNKDMATAGRAGFPTKLPAMHSEVVEGPPRFGFYVLPDGLEPGALEEVLIEITEAAYPELSELTSQFLADVQTGDQPTGIAASLAKKGYRNKTKVSVFSSVFRPGMSVAVALLQSQDWMKSASEKSERVRRLDDWLGRLIG